MELADPSAATRPRFCVRLIGPEMFGIKCGIAATIAFYVALQLRLENPAWSIITVWVIMTARFVGAQAEKAFNRLVGTVLGGCTGYLVTGSLEQNPALFVILSSVAVGSGICWFNQSRAPYAGFLFSLTYLLVAAEGMSAPGQSWQIALARTEEVFLGVIVSVVVSSLVFPRYASHEFEYQVRSLVGALRPRFAEHIRSALEGKRLEPTSNDLRAKFVSLRNLLEYGAFEGRTVRNALGRYSRVVTELAKLHAATEIFRDVDLIAEEYLRAFAGSGHSLADSLDEVFRCLEVNDLKAAMAALAEAESCLGQIMVAVERLGEDKDILQRVTPVESLRMSSWYECSSAAIDGLKKIVSGLSQDDDDELKGRARYSPPKLPPKPRWLVFGVRSGIVVALGLLLQNWLQPPGGSMLTVYAFLFIALAPSSVVSQGDRRAFSHLVAAAAATLIGFLIALVVVPAMADFYVLNALIFAAFLLYVYVYDDRVGIPFNGLFVMLFFFSLVAFNAEEPVPFTEIVGGCIGMLLALVLSTIVRRSLLPLLPGREILLRLRLWLVDCGALVLREPGSAYSEQHSRLLRISLMPSEIFVWVERLLKHPTPPEVRHQLEECVEKLTYFCEYLFLENPQLDPLFDSPKAAELVKARKAVMTQVQRAILACADSLRGIPIDTMLEEEMRQSIAWAKSEARKVRDTIAQDLPVARRFPVYFRMHRRHMLGAQGLLVLKAFRQLDPAAVAQDGIL